MDAALTGIAPVAVYLVVGLLVGIESIGVPFPGETALMAAALLSSHPQAAVSPWGVAAAGIFGAVCGDSIGYGVGRRLGPSLFERLARRFPRYWSMEHIGYAQYLFGRYGMAAVFVGRFVALLRILCGPLAGSLSMSYPRFLAANVCAALVWAGGITFLVHQVGSVAHQWISEGTWIFLALAVVVGLVVGKAGQRAFDRGMREYIAGRSTRS